MITFDPAILDRIDTGLAVLLPMQLSSDRARCLLYAIGLQESELTYRFQIVQGKPRAKGPARGLWQFEKGGGATGVLTHPASRFWAHRICQRQGIPPKPAPLWAQLEHDDALAAAMARLLLFTDPKPLPETTDTEGAWKLYLRTWRPGAWARGTPAKRARLRATWDRNHWQAQQIVMQRAES